MHKMEETWGFKTFKILTGSDKTFLNLLNNIDLALEILIWTRILITACSSGESLNQIWEGIEGLIITVHLQRTLLIIMPQ